MAAELLLAASPEFFIGDDGEIDAEKLDRWVEANLAWLHQRFTGMILAVRLDLDESAPHLAVLVLPTYKKKTKHTTTRAVSYGKAFCGANKVETSARMSALQDDYAAAMSPLGLELGVPKAITGREHLTHQQYVARRIRGDEKKRRKLAEAEAAADRADEREQQVIAADRRARLAEETAAKRLREAEASARVAEARLHKVEAMIEAERTKQDKLERSLTRAAAEFSERYDAATFEADLRAIRKARLGAIERSERVAALAAVQPLAAAERADADDVGPWRPGFWSG